MVPLVPPPLVPTALSYGNETARKCAVIQTVLWVSQSHNELKDSVLKKSIFRTCHCEISSGSVLSCY